MLQLRGLQHSLQALASVRAPCVVRQLRGQWLSCRRSRMRLHSSRSAGTDSVSGGCVCCG